MPPASETRNLREEIPEDLEQLSRRKLQQLAKTHGLKANKKNADIIAELRALAEEQHRPDEPVKVEQHRPEDPEQQENGATARQFLFPIVYVFNLIFAVIAFCLKVTLSGDKLCRKVGILATEVSDDAKATGQTDLFKVKDPANPDPDLAQVLKQEIEENRKQFGEVLEVNMDLAKGAYGQVKKACHLSTGREVAVKVIRPLLAREKVLKQAQEEMLVHQDLIHENVVRLYWGFEEASQYYMILELVPDGDLLDFLCAMKQQNIEEARTKHMFGQLIEGVAYLHDKGVVHRDLKPENILVRKGSVPVLKIADFGEAEKVGTETSMIFRKGTPQTMAPEVSRMQPKGCAPSVHHMLTRSKKGIDEKKADLWSLGMILHVMVVLEYPISADVDEYMSTLVEMAKKAMKEQADFPGLFKGDTQVWDKEKRREHKYKWTDLDKVKDLVKGLLKPVVADRWDLDKVKNCSWLGDKQNEDEVVWIPTSTEVSDAAIRAGQTDLFKVKDPANPDPDLAQVLKQEIEENRKQFGEVLEVNMDLAKGAYGQVKKACHLSTGKEVAVKVIRPWLAREKVLKQAQEEMLVHQDLIHENVVRLYWGFEEASQYYMILELVPDGDLLDFLCAMKQQNIEEARTKHMFGQLIEGVAYLHDKGVVHRDLKPENILVRKGSVPVLKIADFGEAEKVGTETSMIFRKGTPQTMAPEVSRMQPKGCAPSVHPMLLRSKKGIDEKKADLWSLGMILHVMVVLEYPISADVDDVDKYMSTLVEMAKKAMKEQADFPGLFKGDTQVWDKEKRREHKYKWTDLDKVKDLVKGLLKPVVADRWDLDKVKNCSWVLDGTPDKRYKANRR